MSADYNEPKVSPISPAERMKLVPVCRELGIDMAHDTTDRALCEAITEAVLAEVATSEPIASPGIECDGCHVVKPESDFRSPGHLAGGTCNGSDIDSYLCTECAEELRRQVQEDLAKETEEEMASPVTVAPAMTLKPNLRKAK